MSRPLRARQELETGLPDTSTPLDLPGLEDVVEIYRDPYGVPHVRARTVHDAFFAQGFVTAQDRLWHMEHDRRWAYGRWAEYAGEVAAAQDVFMRRLQLRQSVEGDYAAVNAETRAMFDAYTGGVNAFIDTSESMPVEYALVQAQPEPWLPWDCIAVFKARHFLMGGYGLKSWRARLISEFGPQKSARLLPGGEQGHLLIVPPGAEYRGPGDDALSHLTAGAAALDPGLPRAAWSSLFRDADAGSNSWAVSGSGTASGKPLLAGDSHRSLDTPNVYYQNHIACLDFDVIGLSFPGCPGFPHFGHNARVAWCVTHAMADYQDLYVERFKDGSPALYEYEGEWLQAEVRKEVVEVRGGQPIEIDVTVTHHGPVIVGDPVSGSAVAFKYTATDGPSAGLQPLLPMMGAKSADEIEESMREWVDPSNNFLFADVEGDIGYLNRGRLPVRSEANAWLPVPGWTGEHEWQGFVPFEELVRMRNPEAGYIVTANNRIVGEQYPSYIGLSLTTDFRARRVTERLKEIDNATVEDMARVHADAVSVPAQTYVRLLSKVQPMDELSARARRELLAWDGAMDQDAVGPTIYSAFRMQLDRELVEHALGSLAQEALTATDWGAPFHLRMLQAAFVRQAEGADDTLLPPGSDWGSLMARALADAVAHLESRLGEEIASWTWGKVHFTRPRHTLSVSIPEAAPLLDPPGVPLGGNGDTPLAGSYTAYEPFVVSGTSVARYVFDTADWDNSAWVVPLGVSGHPGSRHYSDQALVWADVRLISMTYDWGRIAAEEESRQELRPA